MTEPLSVRLREALEPDQGDTYGALTRQKVRALIPEVEALEQRLGEAMEILSDAEISDRWPSAFQQVWYDRRDAITKGEQAE